MEPSLPALRLHLTFRAIDPILLPPFRGAFWRSVFGLALHRMASQETFDDSIWPAGIQPVSFGPWKRPEIYEALFSPQTKARGGDAPPPFVIDAPWNPSSTWRAGAFEMIGLTLIGAACEALPAVVAAFAAAAHGGLGKSRGRAELVEVAVGWRGAGGRQPVFADGRVSLPSALIPHAPAAPPEVEVFLATPMRLVISGQTVTAPEFRPDLLLEHAVRRISLLQRLYGSSPARADFASLFRVAEKARNIRADVSDVRQQRWSARQSEEIHMDGLVGSLILPIRGLEPLWPWLWASQWFHVGKGASMGLGAIRLRAA